LATYSRASDRCAIRPLASYRPDAADAIENENSPSIRGTPRNPDFVKCIVHSTYAAAAACPLCRSGLNKKLCHRHCPLHRSRLEKPPLFESSGSAAMLTPGTQPRHFCVRGFFYSPKEARTRNRFEYNPTDEHTFSRGHIRACAPSC
jgi:hypothetical protein